MARLYSNENFPLGVVLALRHLGHDVLTSFDAGQANQSIPDHEVLAFAVAQNRALLTLNRRDFILLHLESSSHSGIIVCTQDPDVAGQAERIHKEVTKLESLDGILVRVNRLQA